MLHFVVLVCVTWRFSVRGWGVHFVNKSPYKGSSTHTRMCVYMLLSKPIFVRTFAYCIPQPLALLLILN